MRRLFYFIKFYLSIKHLKISANLTKLVIYIKKKLEVDFLDKRLGVIGIIVEKLENAQIVNEILHNFSDIIVGRMGIPYKEKRVSVISIIVDGSMDSISAMTGKLGNIDGVSVKSAISKK